MWQLRNPKTNENLSDPQPLPENWGPIFGMEGVKDRLGDLSWLGITDQAWFEVPDSVPAPPSIADQKSLVDEQITHYLKETAPMVAMDNLSMTKAERQLWMEYRKKLQEIPLQPNYPINVFWPTKPE